MRSVIIGTLILTTWAAPQTTGNSVPKGPEQPIPFSHKAHAGDLKLACQTCHPNPDPGEQMTIAAASACLQCHSLVKTDSPSIQKLAAAAKNNEPIPWIRVYRIPSFVDFSHRAHLAAGNTCEDCHGKVVERERLYRESDLSKAGCLECHRAKNVSMDCSFCHEPR
jgi:hypothetical protein